MTRPFWGVQTPLLVTFASQVSITKLEHKGQQAVLGHRLLRLSMYSRFKSNPDLALAGNLYAGRGSDFLISTERRRNRSPSRQNQVQTKRLHITLNYSLSEHQNITRLLIWSLCEAINCVMVVPMRNPWRLSQNSSFTIKKGVNHVQ